MMINVKRGAAIIIRGLKAQSFQAYLVGGCIRDALLGKAPEEWDITTSARPQQVAKLFKKVIPTGIEYGTVTILLDDGRYEVTTFRADERYVNGTAIPRTSSLPTISTRTFPGAISPSTP